MRHRAADMFVPSSRSIGQVARALLVASTLPSATATAYAASSSTSYPEPVVHWVVQKGETCAGISDSLYGSPQHTALLLRYNSIDCAAAQLPEGTTLVVPSSVTSLPDARLKSMSPAVRARPSGGGWTPVQSGAPLFKGHNVNTLETGRADIEFVDRTRVFLAENTLVVIYGTAANTAVKKNVRQTVELEQGEVKAGLAALRGNAARVGVQGGGDVQAASRDTVVQRKGDRTTVAVFDGTAVVRNAGAKVDVPTNHGTRFVGAQPPARPRPLPPAPVWEPGGFPSLVIAPPEGATLAAGWQAVSNAKAYRFEIARDDAFRDLVAREEVPSNVRSFRAEKIPAGTFHVSVRAIDNEEYLGVAATRRTVQVVTAVVREGLGNIRPEGLEVTPYTVVALAAEGSPLRVGFDQAEPGPAPAAIDFGKVHPSSIRVQSSGAEVTIPVTWRKVTATIDGTIERSSGRAQLRATVKGLEGIDLNKSVHPSWRVHLPTGVAAHRGERGARRLDFRLAVWCARTRFPRRRARRWFRQRAGPFRDRRSSGRHACSAVSPNPNDRHRRSARADLDVDRRHALQPHDAECVPAHDERRTGRSGHGSGHGRAWPIRGGDVDGDSFDQRQRDSRRERVGGRPIPNVPRGDGVVRTRICPASGASCIVFRTGSAPRAVDGDRRCAWSHELAGERRSARASERFSRAGGDAIRAGICARWRHVGASSGREALCDGRRPCAARRKRQRASKGGGIVGDRGGNALVRRVRHAALAL